MTQTISRKNLLAWLGRLLRERVLIAPTHTAEPILFRPVSKVEDIIFDFDNTAISPKEWFFPATETLFWAETTDGRTELVPATVEREAVIFGLRPCDAMGLALIDKAFLAEPADTLYQQHRDKTVLVGLSCRKAYPQCFCTSMGTAPDDPSYVDILLTQVEEDYIVQIVTQKGKALLPDNLLVESEAVAPPPPSPSVVPAEGIEEVMRQAFDSPYWGRLADRCVHCNLCAYVCPTCYCFDIRDYESKGKIERVRSWESCQSPGFTRQAGGYNPRSSKAARLRQRFYHKLLYFPESFGAIACVGCGRCVMVCPVNIDIRELIADIQKIGGPNVP